MSIYVTQKNLLTHLSVKENIESFPFNNLDKIGFFIIAFIICF
jgi:hypothetical protein